MIDLKKWLQKVVGLREDAAPGMDDAPVDTDTAIEHLKAIRETVGQEPNDNDDSLHTIHGQRDDTTVPTPGVAVALVPYVKALMARGMPIIKGHVTSVTGASETFDFYSTDLIGYGDDYFVHEFSLQLVQASAAANDGITRDILTYTSVSGRITVNVFPADVAVNDELVILHKSQLILVPCEDPVDLVEMTPEVPDHSPLANLLTNDGDTTGYDRRFMSQEGIARALGVILPAAPAAGFEGDGTGTTLYLAVVGVNETPTRTWMDGTTKQSLADMPFIQPVFSCMDSPRVGQDAIRVMQLSLQDQRVAADAIQTGEFAGTTFLIERYRLGVDTSWGENVSVNPAATTEAEGYIFGTYTFPAASWANGDLIRYRVYDCVVTLPAASDQTIYVVDLWAYGVVGGISAIVESTDAIEDWTADQFQEQEVFFTSATVVNADTTMITLDATGGSIFDIKLKMFLDDDAAATFNVKWSATRQSDLVAFVERIYPPPIPIPMPAADLEINAEYGDLVEDLQLRLIVSQNNLGAVNVCEGVISYRSVV